MNKKYRKYLGLILVLLVIVVWFLLKQKSDLSPVDTSPFRNSQGQLIINTSLFPVYDFAKNVGGDKTAVSLILPPGSEAHAYRPSDNDLLTINSSAIFFYTSDLMEPWAVDLKKSVSPRTLISATANGLNGDKLDPHVWLDFSLASQMVDNIKTTYQQLDPQNHDYYQVNAEEYKTRLKKLDDSFFEGLKNCQHREIISGGHQAFGYLTKRYDLVYKSAQDYTPSKDLDTGRVLSLIEEIKDKKIPYVYYEELIMPYLAELIHQGSLARIMPLNSAHNVAHYDIESGITFISLMEADLNILKMSLSCK
jgi:zinc transport system substrate-binding protein